jgi:hypothetical protein
MRILFLLLTGLFLCMPLSGCKEEYKTSPSPGVNVVVQDVPCEEVIRGVISACQDQNLPWAWQDQAQGRLTIGPVQAASLPPERNLKTEEQVRLEIRCLESLSTRISLEIEVKVFTPEQKWQAVTDFDQLNTYGKRFLDRLLKR